MCYLTGAGGDALVTARPALEVPDVRTPAQTIRFTAPGSVTQGRFGLFECRMQPRSGGPGPHYHQTFSESFYVVSGELALYAAGDWTTARAGDFLHVAERGVHGFRNDSDEETMFLILFAPGIAREQYFTELAQIRASGRTPGPEEMADLYARHDQVNL